LARFLSSSGAEQRAQRLRQTEGQLAHSANLILPDRSSVCDVRWIVVHFAERCSWWLPTAKLPDAAGRHSEKVIIELEAWRKSKKESQLRREFGDHFGMVQFLSFLGDSANAAGTTPFCQVMPAFFLM